MRTFLDEGLPIGVVLRHVRDAQRSERLSIITVEGTDYVGELLLALHAQADQHTAEPPQVGPIPEDDEIPVEPLRAREVEMLQLLAEGRSNQEIADRLVVSAGTVRWYLKNIYAKLDVHSRTQAIARARAIGVIA